MSNEIQRKITSLTLMTIMVAGGLTFAIPGVIPEAAAEPKETANLFVSTTAFGGPMVVEVIVRDSNYQETDEAEAEPDVKFDGNDLRMIQARDGYWYAYVAHTDNVMAFDNATHDNPGTGFDFGTLCTVDQANELLSSDFSNGAIVFVASNECANVDDDSRTSNILREAKVPSGVANATGSNAITLGQNGLINDEYWPFIQTWDDFTDDATIDVVYESGGSPQKITIEYDLDMDDRASYEFDREDYPHGADVHLTINDNLLNIDPTDQDVWTFLTNGTSQDDAHAYYYIFDESGTNQLGDQRPINYQEQMRATFDDSGVMFINPTPNSVEDIIIFQENRDQDGIFDIFPITNRTHPQPVTIQETDTNSGVFENTDSSHTSNLVTISNEELRRVDFTFDYVDTTTNRLVDFTIGNVNMVASSIDGDWGSGEPITVEITDDDFNKNTRLDNDFSVSGGSENIPAIQIGNPFTLESAIQIEADEKTLSQPSDAIVRAQQRADALAEALRTAQQNVEDLHVELGLSDLIANKTQHEGWITGNETIRDTTRDVDVRGVARTEIAITETRLTAIQAAIDEVRLNSTAQRIIEDLETAQDDYNAADQSLDDLIATEGSDVGPFSKILNLNFDQATFPVREITIETATDSAFLNDFVNDDPRSVFQYINYDASSLGNVAISVIGESGGQIDLPGNRGLELIQSDSSTDGPFEGSLSIVLTGNIQEDDISDVNNIIFDVFTFGQDDEGVRYNDAIYRYEAEETTNNSGVYTGTVEYIMLNQINIYQDDTYSSLETIGDALDIIVHEDLTDEDGVEMIYLDRDSDGVATQRSDKRDAPTHSAVVFFDQDNYKVADTVTVTLEDADLNTDSDVVDIYTVVDVVNADENLDTSDTIALPNIPDSLLLDVTFDDRTWKRCTVDGSPIGGLASVISSLAETSKDSGVFTTTFQIPDEFCNADGESDTVTGLDLEVNYQDFRDASGETIEVGDSAGVRANTGSISLDRTVYPVPFGQPDEGVDGQGSFFPIHATGIGTNEDVRDSGNHLDNGELMIHVRVNDPDYDVSGGGRDSIAQNIDRENSNEHGPVKIMVTRGSETVLLGTVGAESARVGLITLGDIVQSNTIEYGPILETKPDSGIFEADIPIAFTDGPVGSICPTSTDAAVRHIQAHEGEESASNRHCILQGDILTVEYTDPTDASGDENTITDSATFDLRNGVLQSDKSVYIIGSDMILTLIEPDFDLDNDSAETYDLDLIEWDSDAATTTMGDATSVQNANSFDPEPSALRETGDSTGIFQIVIEIPDSLNSDNLERGEEIVLEYTDWGPSGSDYVGDEDEDINLTIYTSNFGATVELDQKVYTWTDKVYITIVAPDHNFDGDLVDEIGNTDDDSIQVATREADLDNYKLVETGTDTGIFTGEVILTGFSNHDADGDGITGDATGEESDDFGGPTDGFLPARDEDGVSVSFEFSENETVIGSSLVRWNIGDVQWLEASYPAAGTGIVRVIDPDMNLDPEAVNNFEVDVVSDTDTTGINLTVTETNEATGIFEGTVHFTITDSSSGHRLRVAEGDTVTAEYDDYTLPEPYTTGDEITVTSTTVIGTVVPPLERAPATNLRTVDAFGNSLDSVSIDQQVQITADLTSGQDKSQEFAYLLQVQDANGVTVALDWITGELEPAQTFSAAKSWTPSEAGNYEVTVFVWQSVSNPTALSPPLSTTVTVS